MTEKDVNGIEAAVGVILPAHYRGFLLDHAKALKAARKKLSRALRYFDPKDVVAINKRLRDNPRMIEINENTEPWPANYFVVGTNGGGDYWMVDLDDPAEVIWKYDSEAGGRIVPSAYPSWAKYMAGVERDLQQAKK